MCLLAMNWKTNTPPTNFVGFAIEYQEPGATQFYPLSNRLAFPGANGAVNPAVLSSKLSPIQKFRWIHFPFHAGLPGLFTYRVTPVFMSGNGALSYGDAQTAAIQLEAETYPGQLNVCFTRGFISSQAFIDHFGTNNSVAAILPSTANQGLDFKPTYANEETALAWMGFESRSAILNVLDQAAGDSTAQVRVAAYDFNDPEIVSRLQKLGSRLKIIIDDSGTHKPATACETRAAALLVASAGAANVQRQHMGQLQHNKMIAVSGNKVRFAIGGSTNFSWRGIYVQNNNAVVVQGTTAVQLFFTAFDNLWANPNNPTGFGNTPSAAWNDLQLTGIDAKVTFSPHSSANAMLNSLANDISATKSSLFYSLAFLYEAPGPILTSIKKVTADNTLFVYGISDRSVGGLDIQVPDGNPPIAFPAALLTNVPEPFKAEATGGSGIRMHHKFVVIDFNQPNARVYTGSYNFSATADTKNGENLWCIADRRVATSYMIEAVAMFDHYEFRDADAKATTAGGKLQLQKPPTSAGVKPWWDEDWTNPQKKRDRELFGS
jgi:phosphatidylserine/phosphatidylglycerophosphate/cardiolipin synthase-like enzyme